MKKLRINHQIRSREVRLIDHEGEQIGIISLSEAIAKAEHASLDLVEVNPTSDPPVCKILDYGKFRYEQSKKEKEAKQNRSVVDIKEIKFRPKIDVHDYETKKKRVIDFLEDGDKVKITLMFRGREVVYKTQGVEKMNKLAEELGELAVVEKVPKAEGRNITMVLAPRQK